MLHAEFKRQLALNTLFPIFKAKITPEVPRSNLQLDIVQNIRFSQRFLNWFEGIFQNRQAMIALSFLHF